MSKTIPTRKQAESVLALVKKAYADYLYGTTLPGDPGEPDFTLPGLAEIDHPQLRENERETGWDIYWEAGDYDWPIRFVDGLFTAKSGPADVFLEPVNSYTVGVYLP